MTKPILVFDFDGVLHSYVSGWQGAACIPDPPVDGALEFILLAQDHFSVNVFSTRSHQPGGIEAMRAYLKIEFARHMAGFGKPVLRDHWKGRLRTSSAQLRSQKPNRPPSSASTTGRSPSPARFPQSKRCKPSSLGTSHKEARR